MCLQQSYMEVVMGVEFTESGCEIIGCMDALLPPELEAKANEVAIQENPANAGDGGGEESGALDFMAVDAKRMWAPGRVLKVYFMNGSSYQRSKVRQYALVWRDYANIDFTFSTDDATITALNADIRINFDASGRSWSYLGTDALLIDRSLQTMNFGWFTDNTSDSAFARTTIHEFGHALGCVHEHQSPAGGILWDAEKVYAYYGGSPNKWSRTQVDQQILTPYSAKEITQFTKLDPTSIMMYSFPASLTTNGYSTPSNSQLSGMDMTYIAQKYPWAKDAYSDNFATSTIADYWIFDLGIEGGGSAWSIANGVLKQTNDIYVSTVGPWRGERGTYALVKGRTFGMPRIYETECRTSDDDGLGLVWAFTGNDRLMVYWDGRQNIIAVTQVINGSVNVLGSVSKARVPNQWYKLSALVTSGNRILVSLDDEWLMTVSAYSFLKTGAAGVFTVGCTRPEFRRYSTAARWGAMTYNRMDFGFNRCPVVWAPASTPNVSLADMVVLANEVGAKGFTYHPDLRVGQLMVGDYPQGCKSPTNESWPLYLLAQ